MKQGLTRSACLSLFVIACSGSIEGVNSDRPTSTTAGSGGSSGIVGAGGNTVGAGEGGGPSATASTSSSSTGVISAASATSTSGTGGAGGAGGQGGTDAPEAGLDRADVGIDAAADGAILGGDAALQDGGPPPAIDYSIWQLQLPTGSGNSPTTVSPSQLATFTNIYFYKADDGGQVFMSPATGITTANSTRTRTELRESKPNGGAASWLASGTNTITVTGKVLQGSRITVAQVFNGGDGITLAELQYSSSGFTLFYEEARGAGNSTGLGHGTALNAQFTFTMSLSKNVLTVTIDGQQVFMRTPSAGILASTFYFKVGNYDQTTSEGTPGTTPHSIVEDYSIAVAHQ